MSLYTKIHALQKDIDPIKKTEENPFFHSAYFDINGLIEAVQPLLTKHGLVIIQPLSNVNGVPALTTIITDIETGEVYADTVILPVNPDIQKFGASVTYMRRFALQSLLLLQAADDDGETAVGRKPEVKTATKPPVTRGKVVHADMDIDVGYLDPFEEAIQEFGGTEVTPPAKDYSGYVTCKKCGVGRHDPKYPACFNCNKK